jgi:hypothetical protein
MFSTNNLVVNGLITRTIDAHGNGLEVLNADLAFGLAKEDPVINKLATHFGENIVKAEDKYSPFDAYSEKTKYEIKSRRNNYNTFPTTIIAVDKTRTKGRLVFVFHFLDGLYYIEYEPTLFSTFNIENVSAIRRNGVRTEKPHYFIPIENLTKINI